MTNHQIFAIDFGSEYIRLARSTQNPYAPQILSPHLLNAVRVDRAQGTTAVGSKVYDGVQTGALISGLNLFDEKLGHGALAALQALLQEIYRMLEIGRLSAEQRQEYTTIYSLPIGSPPNFLEIGQARLLENGFPTPRAYPAANAIMLNFFPDNGFRPGKYLIVDCGTLCTRVALGEANSSKTFSKLVEKVSSTSGGNEIDRILLEHFLMQLNDPDVDRVELLSFVRRFKAGFMNSIRQDLTKYSIRSPFSAGISAFNLSLEDFRGLSRHFFETMEKDIVELLEHEQILPAKLEGLLLAGGNAQWPFIYAFVERLVGKNKVFVSEYPEDTIVRGLSLSNVEPHSSPDRVIAEAPAKPSKYAKTLNGYKNRSKVQPQKQTTSFPLWLAILLEFFPGLLGVLGLGWLVGTQTIFGLPWRPWILLMLVWPVLMILLLIVLISTSFQFSNWTALILFFPVWLGVPFISGLFAFRVTNKKRREKNG